MTKIGNYKDLVVDDDKDIMRPHYDGIDICCQIREKKNLDDVVILFLTARVEEYTEVAAFGAGL